MAKFKKILYMGFRATLNFGKKALKKAIGKAVLTPFELYTCLLEVANVVNQRPIGRIPNDPDDGAYLCPNDILLGRATNTVPQGPFRHTENLRHRFEFCQKIVDSFWKKWFRDVLPSLVPRKKWNAEKRNVAVNDFVIMQTPTQFVEGGARAKFSKCFQEKIA